MEVIGRLYPDEDTHLGPIARYQREGADEADALLHGSAVLAGLPVQAMDNGGERTSASPAPCPSWSWPSGRSRSTGSSTRCRRTREICGWMVDVAGFSWQTGPADLGELMDLPGAYGVMIARPRPVLANYEPLRAQRP